MEEEQKLLTNDYDEVPPELEEPDQEERHKAAQIQKAMQAVHEEETEQIYEVKDEPEPAPAKEEEEQVIDTSEGPEFSSTKPIPSNIISYDDSSDEEEQSKTKITYNDLEELD
jgi:hypothetical protein